MLWVSTELLSNLVCHQSKMSERRIHTLPLYILYTIGIIQELPAAKLGATQHKRTLIEAMLHRIVCLH